METLEYLNLNFGITKKKNSIDKKQLFCFGESSCKHKFHYEDQHLNLIFDLYYSIFHNLTLSSYSHDKKN